MFWLLADKYNCSLGCRLCFCAPSCCFAGVFPLSPMAKPLFKDIVSVLCGSLRTLNSGTLLKTEAHKNHSLYIWGFSFTQPPWAIVFSSDQFSSVAQSCPTLCDPMNHSTPGLPVQHQLPEFTQWTSQWCHPAISSSVIPFSYYPQSLPASESFPMSQLFTWGGQSTGVSALASLLPKKSQGWFPSEWTGWISLQSKGLSRVFSNTTVQKNQFFGAQPSSQSNSHIHTWPQEKP